MNRPLENPIPNIQPQRIAIGLSSNALQLLLRLKRRSHIDHFALTPLAASNIAQPPDGLLVDAASELIGRFWEKGNLILIIGSIGAVTRLVAPLLQGKGLDPAVLVLDAFGDHVVPLLGGHQAGAELIAIQLAEDLGGNPVLTSDTRSQSRIPLDSFGEGWGWKRTGNADAWKKLMFANANDQKIELIQSSGSLLWQTTGGCELLLSQVENNNQKLTSKLFIGAEAIEGCCWHPPTLWIGFGCERGTSHSLIERAVFNSLDQAGLAKEAIAGIATLELKSDEHALIDFVNHRDWHIRFFSSQQLAAIDVPNPSLVVKAEVQTPSVAEASALLAAGKNGKLLKEKEIFPSEPFEKGAVTIAIAEAVEPFAPSRGEIHLVGSGPGDLSFLTQDARSALARSSIWVGYRRYLKLLEGIRRSDQARLDGELTHERERCIQALDLATQGAIVSLVSSGDSGIYGMAGLALELWLDKPKKERPKFEVHPGISAIQMAASRAGALLMDDFCTISLSDRLTSWQTIKERLLFAVKGDFVVALYNPKSIERDWQLIFAIELFKKYRSPKTPLLFARQLGRLKEEVATYQLDNIPINKVDMLTIIVIGNSKSLNIDNWLFTPRGYL